jgi:hypothetical protein
VLSVRLRTFEPFTLVVFEILAAERALAQILTKMGGVGTTATVAADENKSPLLVALVEQVGELFDLPRGLSAITPRPHAGDTPAHRDASRACFPSAK